MAGNKYLIPDQSKILQAKMEALSTRLQQSLASKEFQTQEAYLFEAIKILDEFYASLSEPTFNPDTVRVDDYPDPEVYNKLWNNLLNDLISVFRELENIESLTIANFNFVSTEANRLIARLKSVSSKLGDYILYAVDASKDFIYFKDSFNDLSRIDNNSPLLNKTQAEVNQVEGIITLPINKDKDSRVIITQSPVINATSNGNYGNNYESGATWNGDLSVILDDNPDTWFEYERVVIPSQDIGTPLILDLTLNLGEPKIINRIRVNPNNFGTRTVIQIDDISTSIDGNSYTSIKDDIPIGGFVTEDEENIFTLAPSTSKYAGQGIYSFTPRSVKYVRFQFRQVESYIITTSVGDRNRYAIGIRDIDVRGYAYSPEGEIVSLPYETNDEIRKVILQVNQNPSEESDLAEIRYYISPDDGVTWSEIAPENISAGQYRAIGDVGSVTVKKIPEVIEFNGSSPDTIETSSPVYSVRVKASLSRDDTAFAAGTYSLKKESATASELHPVPQASPFSFNLNYSPIDGTVVVVDPMYGSRGREEAPYVVGFVQGGGRQAKYRLPFTKLPRPVTKEADGNYWNTVSLDAANWSHCEINGEEWAHATKPLSGYSSQEKVFSLGINTGILEFGNGSTSALPPENSRIDLYFDEERLFPAADDSAHIAKLDFSTTSNKEAFTLKRYEEAIEFTQVIPSDQTTIKLAHDHITDYTGLASTITTGHTRDEETFVNGRDELVDPDDWSIDPDAGIVYLRTPLSSTSEVVVSYTYQPQYALSSDDWDWAKTSILRDSIQIKDDAWKTISKTDSLALRNDTNILELEHLSIAKGTLSITASGTGLTDANNPFLKEVEYIDGRTELRNEATKTQENVPSMGTGVQSFTLGDKIHSSTNYPAVFSNKTLFVTDKGSTVITGDPHGTYYVNRTTNTVQVRITTVPDSFGTVTYYYRSPSFKDEGLYSVNYPHGKIHTQRQLDSNWTASVKYEYSDYRAEYYIARLLNPKDYQVDIVNKAVKILDSEIYQRAMLPSKRPDGFPPQYLVNYDYVAETREDIEGLRDYFSPVLKDYSLKVLLKGRIY